MEITQTSQQILRLNMFEPPSMPDTNTFAKNLEFFKTHNYLKIPHFLDDALKERVKQELMRATFVPTSYKVGKDETFYDGPLPLISFLMKSPLMFKYIEKLTGRQAKDFTARGFKMTSESQGYSWHTDLTQSQTVGITICLSPNVYKGGTLLMRPFSQVRPTEEIINTQFGDAVLFGVSSDWEHMVTPVVGLEPKISFVGWYFSEKITNDAYKNLYEN